jgi:signal transduction histidine kinase
VTGPLPVVKRRVDRVGHRWQGTPIRTQLTAAAALAATVAILAVVAVAYVVVRHELLSNIDGQLRNQATKTVSQEQPYVPPIAGEEITYVQFILSDGESGVLQGRLRLPFTKTDVALAVKPGSEIRTVAVGGKPFRIYTHHGTLVNNVTDESVPVAIQYALPLTAAQTELHKLRVAFLFLALLGLLLVILATWFVVRRTMRPVASLTEAAEQIAITKDLTTRIDVTGDDELGRLAEAFNTMLDALERSLGQQRQLILDASHELRTPLASLRTNVEVLHDVDRLSVDQRRSLLDGIVTQLDELTVLVADVVELARGEAPASAQEDVALDDVLARAVDRSRRHWPQIVFMLEAEPVTVRGVPSRLDRAIANLLDNAGKFSPSGSVVDATVTRDGVLTVADRGPGIPDDALPYVFDRFYRADEARAMPGSGLGLAIVKQVIDGHHGTVEMANRPDGGTVATVTLPIVEPLEGTNVPMIEAAVEPAS